jgi:hypothetical protein
MSEAMLWITGARLLVRFFPFRSWRRWMGPIGSLPGKDPLSPSQRASALRAYRCVRRVSAHAPFRARCLPKAMATRWMLARRGIATELHIGAKTAIEASADKPIDLHAWILCGPLRLTGADQRMLFSPFAGPFPLSNQPERTDFAER